MKKRAVGYCRISTLMQVDNTSLKDQEDKIRMYAKLHDIVIDEMFIDKAVSGKSTDRPEYDKMMDYVKINNIDMIVVYKNDRIHRSLYNLLAMIYELQKYEVALVSVTEMFDTSTPQGMLFLQMLGSFAEFERAVINERTRNGRIARLNENKWVGGKPAFGYKVNKHGKFEIDEEEAIIVKDIFKLRSKGISLAKIGAKYGFSKQKVDYILKNKNYIGVFEYNGTTTEPSDDNPAWLKQVAEGQKGEPGLSVIGGMGNDIKVQCESSIIIFDRDSITRRNIDLYCEKSTSTLYQSI